MCANVLLYTCLGDFRIVMAQLENITWKKSQIIHNGVSAELLEKEYRKLFNGMHAGSTKRSTYKHYT